MKKAEIGNLKQEDEKIKNQRSADYSCVLTNNRKFRTFNVIDYFNRQGIPAEVAHSTPAIKVTSLLETIIVEQGKPKRVRTDNGPKFISKEFR
jgi:putative transposase